jgi:hypothetical protein
VSAAISLDPRRGHGEMLADDVQGMLARIKS